MCLPSWNALLTRVWRKTATCVIRARQRCAPSGEFSSVAETDGMAHSAAIPKPGRPKWQSWAVAGGSLGLLIIAALVYLQSRTLPPPKVSGYVPVTHDGNLKYLVGTDGARLYFNEFPSAGLVIAQVS